MKLLHLSDLHVSLPLSGKNSLRQYLGRLNWILFRGRHHSADKIKHAVAAVLREQPDAVVISGDLTQLGQDSEFEYAYELLKPLADAGIPILCSDGNHDHYAANVNMFYQIRTALLGDLKVDSDFVCNIGNKRIILLDQGVPASLFRSGGSLGAKTESIKKRLSEGDISVAVGHFPVVNEFGKPLPSRRALREDTLLAEWLGGCDAYLCGHRHRAFISVLSGGCLQICAGSISTSDGELWQLSWHEDRLCVSGICI